ncbi:MAG: hypothetical protein HYT73_03895 [Candidatus Aenigmarchaeota archaeon]|nr:hypothetical protein [Candidatus Aenigmarchaeota archaeon]
MPVVRIDKKLLQEIKDLIGKEENRYQYPSAAAFVNSAVFEKLKNSDNRKKGGRNG